MLNLAAPLCPATDKDLFVRIAEQDTGLSWSERRP